MGLGTWMPVSPSTNQNAGYSPDAATLDEAGEWWLEIDGMHQTMRRVPLYVDMATPRGAHRAPR